MKRGFWPRAESASKLKHICRQIGPMSKDLGAAAGEAGVNRTPGETCNHAALLWVVPSAIELFRGIMFWSTRLRS